MSNTQSQLAEVNSLIAASPDDLALQKLREDLLQLMALEKQESESSFVDAQQSAVGSAVASEKYVSQGTFMAHVMSKEAVAEAPDLGAFQPVTSSSAKSTAKSQLPATNGDDAEGSANAKDNSPNTGSLKPAQPSEKKKKKKKKGPSDDVALTAKFELPSHLVPLESDTPAQKLKKQRTAKALKSKFREKISIAEHTKKQNEWTSFTGGGSGKKRKKGVAIMGKRNGSIFSTEEGVNAKVGVISGGGGRKMTEFVDPNKRYKFS